MDPTVAAVLGVCMRWTHIVSVIALLGSLIYARFIMIPSLAVLTDASARADVEKKVRGRFRPLAYLLIATTLGSGLYNYLNKGPVPAVYRAAAFRRAARGPA